MALDAGEVYLVVGAHLDSASFTKANAAMKATKEASDGYQASMDRGTAAAKRLETANEHLWAATKVGAKVAGIGILGVGAALATAAGRAVSFDAAMRNVNSIAGLSEGQLKKLEKQVLALGPATGVGPTELAKGLYDIVSTGFKANDAVKILAVSAKAAKAGLTDTATATDAITSALKAYGLGASHAREVSDLMFETVDVGKLNFEQLATSIGTVLPTAAALGVPLKELGAGIATITLNGTNAKTATTELSAIFTAFQKSGATTDLAKTTKSWGFETSAAALKSLGLKGVLDRLHGTVADGSHTWSDYFKDVRALRGAQGLEGTANAANLFTTSTKAMDEAVKGSGATQKAFAEQSKSTSVQFDKLKASLDVAAVTIGTALLPSLNQGLQAFSGWLAEAQKSGDLERLTNQIRDAVTETITYLHSLGPEASQAFHAVSATIHGAIPLVEALVKALQEVAPVLEDIVQAAGELASAIGPTPILASVAAFLLLRRSVLTTQVALGGLAKVMQAGTLASSTTSVVGFASALGKTETAAARAGSKVGIFARGLVSTIGAPNLIAAGVAGIVLGIVAIERSVTSLKQEAQDAVNALAELEGGRVAKAAAKIGLAQAQEREKTAKAALGGAAEGVAKARAAVPPGGHPDIANPQVTAAIDHQKSVILNYQSAVNGTAQAVLALDEANGNLAASADKYGKQLEGLGEKARSSTQKLVPQGFHGVSLQPASAQTQADAFARSLKASVAAATDLSAAGKAAGNAIADTVKALGRVPDKKEFDIIAKDTAAGKSLEKIRADLGWIGKGAKPTVDANTAPANAKLAGTKALKAQVATPVVIPVTAPSLNPIQTALSAIDTKILHLTSNPWTVDVVYAATGTTTPPGGKKKKASGGKTDGPEVALIGEGGAPEYVIPTETRYRARGIDLWMQAGKDLGIPGYKAGYAPPNAVRGTKKPGATPPPIHKGLGYDPAALDTQEGNEKDRLAKARQYRDDLNRRITSDEGHRKTLEHELDTAKTATGSKNKKTAAAAQKRVTSLNGQIANLDAKLKSEKAARNRQRDVVIPADERRYALAHKAAQVGDDHAAKITLWQDRGDAATSAMQLASNKWDAANRKHDQKGMDAALKEWTTARGNRVSALEQVKTLLAEVQKVVGKTDYGAQIGKQLTDTLADIDTANDETSSPDYTAPQPPSTDLADYLNPWEITAGEQIDQAIARAALTDDTSDDVSAAQSALGLAKEVETRLEGIGAPTGVITQALEAVKSAQDALTSASAPGSVSADQQALIDQANKNAAAATANAASSEAALKVFADSGDLFSGQGITVNVGVQALSAGDASSQRQIGTEVVKALGAQPYVPTSTGYYRG